MIHLETIFAVEQDPNVLFTALMPALCEALQCDRCFLYLRNALNEASFTRLTIDPKMSPTQSRHFLPTIPRSRLGVPVQNTLHNNLLTTIHKTLNRWLDINKLCTWMTQRSSFYQKQQKLRLIFA